MQMTLYVAVLGLKKVIVKRNASKGGFAGYRCSDNGSRIGLTVKGNFSNIDFLNLPDRNCSILSAVVSPLANHVFSRIIDKYDG
jgi:hypothetical protein